MPTSNVERQRAFRERQTAKMAALESLYAAVITAAGRGHKVSAAVLDDDVAVTITHLAAWINKVVVEPPTTTAQKPVVVADVRMVSVNNYEIYGEREQAGISTLAAYLAEVQHQGMTADIPALFWGICPTRHDQPGTTLRLTTATGVETLVVVWEQPG